MKAFIDSVLGRISILVTVYSGTCGIAYWAANKWDIGQLSLEGRWWLLFLLTGVLLPSLVFALAGIWLSGRPAEFGADHEAHLKSLVRHFLEGCYEDISYLALELTNERGSGFLKSRDQQLRALKSYAELCRKKIYRDKKLLKSVAGDREDAVQVRYAQIKNQVMNACDEVIQVLANSKTADEAREAIRISGHKLRVCGTQLEESLENLR